MDAVELTRELIKIESTDPGSWETEIGEYICDYLKESGADTEAYEVEPGRKIVKGVVKGAKAHPALVFIWIRLLRAKDGQRMHSAQKFQMGKSGDEELVI